MLFVCLLLMHGEHLLTSCSPLLHADVAGKNELRGRNINLLVPSPFAEHHDNVSSGCRAAARPNPAEVALLLTLPPPASCLRAGLQYVKTYIQTGKGAILDKVSDFVALHKERYVFSVKVRVTKVMGMSQDSIFMGVVEVSLHTVMGAV